MKILSIIPARAGSKRIANKNIKLCAGKPLIAWTIEAALSSKLQTDVVVSTDSEEIARIAQQYGAQVPFLRPENLAGDKSDTFDTLKFTLAELSAQGHHYDYLILLQATSPLRKAFHIDEAFSLLVKSKAKAVISVSRMEQPCEWSMTLPDNHSLNHFIDNNLHYLKTRSQDLPNRYHLNGSIFCIKIQDYLQEGTFYLNEGVFAYPMMKQHSIDIDEQSDFDYAEYLLLKQNTIK